MKKDIYAILAKHFSGEATPEEEILAEQFRDTHTHEYSQLEKIWVSKGEINIHDFDTGKAWKKIIQIQKTKPAKVIPLYRRLMRVAAVAAILIVGSFLAFNYFYRAGDNLEILVENTMNEGKIIALSDGTKVWLNRNSVLHYPKKFSDKEREVKLEGEAFFDVKRDESKAFIIETHNAFTKVLGTSFNIRTTESLTDVTVATGKVEVRNQRSEKIVLVAGETGKVNNDRIEKTEEYTPNTIAWKTGEFTFVNTSMSEALEDLNTYYNNQFSVENISSNCELSVHFKQANIEDVVETIELICGTKFYKEEGKFILK